MDSKLIIQVGAAAGLALGFYQVYIYKIVNRKETKTEVPNVFPQDPLILRK